MSTPPGDLSTTAFQKAGHLRDLRPLLDLTMRVFLGVFAILVSSVLAADLPCDVQSDNCRAVINGSACFNEFMSAGNVNSILNCLAGTEGSATPKQKVCRGLRARQQDLHADTYACLQMCACTGCVAPVLVTLLNKNNVCSS